MGFFEIYFVILLVIILLTFRFISKNNDNLLDMEKGLIPLYTAKCIVWIGFYREFFVRLTLYEAFIVIKSTMHKIVLNYSDIKQIDIKKDLIESEYLWIKSAKLPDIKCYFKDPEKIAKLIESRRNKSK